LNTGAPNTTDRAVRPLSRHLRSLAIHLVVPALVYLAAFVALTGSLVLRFSGAYFTDSGDGLQNVWNLWWVDRAVRAHQSPWWTNLLHFPSGTSLVGHTLNPFNGFLAVVLLRFLTLVQTHNTIVIFSFVTGGLGTYALARYLGRGYLAALGAGAIFTFSNYHFAHANGHMQLVALEWIPFFVLAFLRLLDRPRAITGMAAGVALGLVLLCDYYYFFYCVLAGMMIVGVEAWQRRDATFFVRGTHRNPFLTFAGTALVACGPLVLALLTLGQQGVEGSHLARDFSLDLFGLIVPGGHWRFAELTRGYWQNLPGNIHESSVHLGLAACSLLMLSLVRVRPWQRPVPARARTPHTAALWFLCAAFTVLSLGPVLHVWGCVFPWVKLPYGVLGRLLPPLRMSGCPVRMTVFVVLAASLLIAAEVEHLWRTERKGRRWRRAATVGLLAVMTVEFVPKAMPLVMPETPAWVHVLAGLRKDYALYDLENLQGDSLALYYQTAHAVPMVGGYIARVPSAVARQDRALEKLAHEGNLQALCEQYGVGYVLARRRPDVDAALLHTDGQVALYDLTKLWPCRAMRR
jgi:hypothetical protein